MPPWAHTGKYKAARILAVDLSLSSLCYAKRKMLPAVANKIEHSQAFGRPMAVLVPLFRWLVRGPHLW
jgi:hypothetical protein